MKNLIRKILKEEISGVPDRQQKLYDYAIKEIMDGIQFIPHYVTYESIDDVLDDPTLDAIIEDIMNNWREMDARGWRVGDAEEGTIDTSLVFSKKSDPSRFMNFWEAKEAIAEELMEELVEEGKYVRLLPEENPDLNTLRPDGTVDSSRKYWRATTPDYEVKAPNISPLIMNIPLWYHPFDDDHYPYGLEDDNFKLPLIDYLEQIYGITIDESEKLLNRIKKEIRDKIEEEGISVDYNNTWGARLNEGVIDDFVNFTKNKLELGDDFTVELEGDGDDLETLASYDMEDNKVKVLSKNRATPDIIRSIAHELVHHKQNQKGELTGDKEDGEDGAPLENEANSLAGYLVRLFGKLYPEIYDL